jgi:hypothetical protein
MPGNGTPSEGLHKQTDLLQMQGGGAYGSKMCGVPFQSRRAKDVWLCYPRSGFYSFNILGEGEVARASCIIQVLQGEANVKKLEEELKHLINS